MVFSCLCFFALVIPLLAEEGQKAISEFWEARQKRFETIESQMKQEWKTFDGPPGYVYEGTDSTDRAPTFYAPLQGCRYLPEFQSLFTEGTASQYFKYTLAFGMKDIIRFHGHSCEALYYTAAIARLIADRLFPNGVIDRTLLRGISGEHPCATDSLAYITGGRLQYGTLRFEPSLGHSVVLQRIDTGETWMGAWKDGINSWNPVTVFGPPNKNNPSPHKRWSSWKGEPDTPDDQLSSYKIRWKYEKPELLQRLRDLKDNLKNIGEGQRATVDPNAVREEFNWLQYWHLKQVFCHPLEESFQIKRIPHFKWEFPRVDPMWFPRMDQGAKWAPYPNHPHKMEKQ